MAPDILDAIQQEHGMDIDQVYEQHVRPLSLAERLRLAERIVAQAAIDAAEGRVAPVDAPSGPLGPRLRAIRTRIEQSGEPLLDEDGVAREIAERRGGAEAWEQAERANVR